MIRICQPGDTERIYFIINEAAKAYQGVIPADCYQQPYMPLAELAREIAEMTFFGWEEGGEMVGVIGFQPVKDITLIRHAYVLPRWQRQGIASRLIDNMKRLCKTRRLLVGTWADADWAVALYVKHGFKVVPNKDALLKTYWKIPRRQIETSVVLGMEMGKNSANP